MYVMFFLNTVRLYRVICIQLHKNYHVLYFELQIHMLYVRTLVFEIEHTYVKYYYSDVIHELTSVISHCQPLYMRVRRAYKCQVTLSRLLYESLWKYASYGRDKVFVHASLRKCFIH